MGFDWRLVQYLIEQLSIGSNHLVLDPFCGAGTTLVQCKKRGIPSVGIDANPVCTLASQVKTSWNLRPAKLNALLERTLLAAEDIEDMGTVKGHAALQYLKNSGMIDRGWLSLYKARKVLALRVAVQDTPMRPIERRFFKLALISALVSRIADIKFGPELYCLSKPKGTAVKRSFVDLVSTMISDVERTRSLECSSVSARVIQGDSRSRNVLSRAVPNGADFVITSPPYPNEHDYTRNTRLELVVLGFVQDIADLRLLKKGMLRCNTKGLYKSDSDSRYSAAYSSVEQIARNLDRRAKGHTDRFSQLYGRMVREYFGGIVCHLKSVMNVLRPGGRCAYVVRDQKSLLGLYIDTPNIISDIATSPAQGFQLEDVIEWRKARGSTGVRTLKEKIIVLRKPTD